MEKIEIRSIKHNSKEYFKLVELRDVILRKPLGLKFTDAQLEAENEQLHFGCFFQENLVGTFILVALDKTELKIRQVAVDEASQNKGVGLKMINFAMDFAKKNGFKKLTCHARVNANGFWSKCEFEIVSEEFLEVGIPHFKMAKTVY